MHTGTNLKYTKAYNARLVLEIIRLNAPLSRADIARQTELTPQTVSNIVKQLLDQGLVVEAARQQQGRGAPSITLDLNSEGAFSIGLDFDRDHLTGVLVDLSGSVHQRLHYDLDFPSPDEALRLMESTTHALLQRAGLQQGRLWGLGIGVPGPLDIQENGIINVINPEAFPGWHDVPVVDEIARRLRLPTFLENNANAAAIGERWYGAGQRIPSFFYLFFGVGLGGGLILNGHPYDGFTGNAGELGYLPALFAGPDAPGQTHIGQDFHLPRLYDRLRAAGTLVSTPAELGPLLEAGHPDVLAWLDTAEERLALLVLAIEYIVDPEAIFFGGRLPDVLLVDLMQRLERRLPGLRIAGKRSVPQLIQATVGADAAALGAAMLPMYESFAPAPHVLMKRAGAGQVAPFVPARPAAGSR